MKLTRIIYAGGVQAFYAPAAELVSDVQLLAPPGEGETADHCLMFVDVAAGEATGFLFTETEAAELASLITRPRVEVVRTFPGGLLGQNGDAAT